MNPSSSLSSILIVEDEPNLGHTLNDYLKMKEFKVSLATTLKEARNELSKNNPNIILLDINLPDGNGVDFAAEVKATNREANIIFLSAQNDPQLRLKGFEIGALDYLTKPFELKELTLRLENINNKKLKSVKSESVEHFQVDQLDIDLKKFSISLNQQESDLSVKEVGILKCLINNINIVVPRDKIIDEVWGQDQFPSNRTVDNYIVKLRKLLNCSEHPLIMENHLISIDSIRGVGYKFSLKKTEKEVGNGII